MQIIQIIPRLPPPVCGVADYALNLGRLLDTRHGYNTRLVSASADCGHTPPPDFPVEFLHSRSVSALKQALLKFSSAKGVILHFSGYGYTKRGAPLWLARAVRQLQREGHLPPLHVMFHELWSRGGVLTSSFWNWPLQKLIIKQLSIAASSVITNREVFAAKLSRFRSATQSDVQVLPVMSGFGEPTHQPPLMERPRHMAYFSWPMSEEKAKVLSIRLRAALAQTKADTLVVFRHPLPDGLDLGIPVESHSVLPAHEISQRLLACQFAFSDYIPTCLGKSSLFAAYCAHGLATVLHEGAGNLSDGLFVGRHVLPLISDASDEMPDPCSVANAANIWYKSHNLAATASLYAASIANAPAEAP